MKVKEIIVVEGKKDTEKIKRTINADTIETNGSAINEETLRKIKYAHEKRGIIVFTDPDYAGMRIRHIIEKEVPDCKHAFLPLHEARSKRNKHKSVGIEHASGEAIKQALENVYERLEDEKKYIDKSLLFKYKLIGYPCSKERREKLGDILCIGYTNGKQLLKRLHMFHIKEEELKEAMERIILDERRLKDDE